jgi:hypothetical protein
MPEKLSLSTDNFSKHFGLLLLPKTKEISLSLTRDLVNYTFKAVTFFSYESSSKFNPRDLA